MRKLLIVLTVLAAVLVVACKPPPPPPPPTTTTTPPTTTPPTPPDPNEVVGRVTSDITRTTNFAGETALGDVVADAFLAATQPPDLGDAVLAFISRGGLRDDLLFDSTYAAEAVGEITYGEALAVLPFANTLVTKTMTGDMLRRLLLQQFSDCGGPNTLPNILQVSAGFFYSYDSTLDCAQRITHMSVNGVPVASTDVLRVATNSFLASGGEGFTVFTEGTDPVDDGLDIDALVGLLRNASPLSPGPMNRITRLG